MVILGCASPIVSVLIAFACSLANLFALRLLWNVIFGSGLNSNFRVPVCQAQQMNTLVALEDIFIFLVCLMHLYHHENSQVKFSFMKPERMNRGLAWHNQVRDPKYFELSCFYFLIFLVFSPHLLFSFSTNNYWYFCLCYSFTGCETPVFYAATMRIALDF
jgi:hypothetical protein